MQRNTCYALLSAVESDLREHLRAVAQRAGRSELFTAPVRERAAQRWTADNKGRAGDAANSDFELLDYADFADLAQVLRLLENDFTEISTQQARDIANRLERLSPARNRVCHSRPLEPDDLSGFLDFTMDLTVRFAKLTWPQLGTTLADLAERPSFVLGLQIPNYWAEQSRVLNNLPLPEWEDTGFLGRWADRRAVGKSLLSAYPVVTVVGEGGVGKTALAVRCLYDLLDGEENPFDAIVWVSLKTKTLSAAGVRQMESAITSTLGLMQNIATELIGDVAAGGNQDELIEEVIRYLSEFPILLAIDNFETLTNDSLHQLLSSIPKGSKVLLTSRVGLGEFEWRYPLDPLDEQIAVDLMRRYARTLNLRAIAELEETLLRQFCGVLHRNPLLIRWFVSSVANGAEPQRLLLKQGQTYESVLRFCFENLFARLSEPEQRILQVLVSAGRPLSQAELLFLMGEEQESSVAWALNVLHHSSLVRRQIASADGAGMTTFTLTEMAAEYIERVAPPKRELFEQVRQALKKLKDMVEEQAVLVAARKYDVDAIRAATKDQAIAAVHLRQALTTMAQGDYSLGRKLVDRAKQLAPGYAEAYRISGRLEEAAGDTFRAATEYEAALELTPDAGIARYSYALFLARVLSDYEGAVGHLDKALVRDPDDLSLHAARAQVLVWSGNPRQAAQAYEGKLLPVLETRPKRERLAWSDQAGVCYSKWASHDLLTSDDSGFRRHIGRAVEIYVSQLQTGTFDETLVIHFIEAIDHGLAFAAARRDSNMARTLLRHLIAQSAAYKGAVIQLASLSDVEALYGRESWFNELKSAPFYAASAVVPPEQVPLQGEIHSLTPGTLYGWIRDVSGKSWFFHRSSLTDREAWPRLRQGQRVRFRIGTNRLGECADSVTLVGIGNLATSYPS